jgi:cytochrome c-type biogenesis protein CcsB
MEPSAVLFGITFAFYCAAAILYLWNVLGGSGLTGRLATGAAVLGLAAHTGAIAARGIAVGRMPFTNLFESLSFSIWALVAIYLLMERRYRITALGAFVSLVAFGTILGSSVLPKNINDSLVPALKSHWSSIHVTTSLISYASFALAFGAAIGYILQERMLKAKRITVLQKHLPSLDVMDHLAYRMVAIGFPMLTLGVITGSLWAQTAWGSYWNWDPKETWSLITWLVYAAYLHVRIVQGWRGKWANRLLIAGFACILITYFGVNFLAAGLHKYNW